MSEKIPFASPRAIYKKPCGPCPSAHYSPDPESIDMREMYKAGRITVWDATFRCAWRKRKLCKGICDYMGVTEADLRGPQEYTL